MTAASAPAPILERRRERRVPVSRPILVRGTDHAGERFEERTSSINLCRGGAAFSTHYALDLGSRLEINIPLSPFAAHSDAEFSTHGRIVHVDAGAGGRELLIGVEFTGPRFHHMFVSEGTS